MPKSSSTSAPLPQLKPAQLRTFHSRLSAWYGTHGRHSLPWRQTSDAYTIWVSEVMLQQTQVATVLERFYHPFLKTFPTIQHLATAPREKVMKAWEGLGYYRRAGFLHEAAKRAHNGLPDNAEGLMDLPGIGRNTAHAILAFAHRQPVPILEANVKRVVARIFALKIPSDQQLWDGVHLLLSGHLSEPSTRSEPAQEGKRTKTYVRSEQASDKKIGQRNGLMNPFDYNQAMMDLGSAICTPKAPQCPACPANTICRGQTHAEHYPAPKAKKLTPTRWIDIFVSEDAKGRLYLEKRSDALLGGLYGFPQKISDPASYAKHAIGHVTHTYSHFKLEGRVIHQMASPAARSTGWYTKQEIRDLPLSMVDHKVLALVAASHSPAPKAKKPRSRRK